MRFVQISDVHLGASLAASALGLPAAKQDVRRRELAGALRHACQLARDNRAEVLLLPGDLFDHEAISRDTLAEAIDTLGGCGIAVVLAPGNHDFYSPSSYYEPRFLRSRHNLAWPANVHLFAGGGWSRLVVPELPAVRFTGVAFTSHDGPDDRPLTYVPRPEPGVLNVLVFHGSRTGHAPPGKQAVLPFDDVELAHAGYDYAAVGHYHSYSVIRGAGGETLGAYSGCPAGRGLDECGPKGVLLGELGAGGVQLELVPVDGRTIHDIAVDCSGLDHSAAVLRRIEEVVRGSGCRTSDILYLRLVGRHGRTLDLRIPAGFLDDRCFHLRVDAGGLVPDYDLDGYRDGVGMATTEGRFVRAIEQRMAATRDEAERERLQQALYYGLDALTAGQVSPHFAAYAATSDAVGG